MKVAKSASTATVLVLVLATSVFVLLIYHHDKSSETPYRPRPSTMSVITAVTQIMRKLR